MTLLVSAVAFLLLLSFLVLIHECGHFFAARRAGVKVEEFGFGLPPRAKTLFTSGGTKFSLNWIPFGGFVRLQGENVTQERDRRTTGSFAAASIPARVIILTAGVLMNFVFAIVVFTAGFSWLGWVPTYLSIDAMKEASERGEITMSPSVRIAGVQPGGTAALAKVPAGSMLLKVDEKEVFVPRDVVEAQQGKTAVTYSLKTGEPENKQFTVRVPVRDGKTGIEIEFAPDVTSPKRSVGQSFMLSLREAKVTSVQTIVGIAQLFRSLASSGSIPEGITGIVGIAQLTHSSVQEGFSTYLRLMAVLSLSLAILNILPFPALDGGRLIFVLVEAIAHRPAPRRFELIANTMGFIVLIVLILLVTFNDILNLF